MRPLIASDYFAPPSGQATTVATQIRQETPGQNQNGPARVYVQTTPGHKASEVVAAAAPIKMDLHAAYPSRSPSTVHEQIVQGGLVAARMQASAPGRADATVQARVPGAVGKTGAIREAVVAREPVASGETVAAGQAVAAGEAVTTAPIHVSLAGQPQDSSIAGLVQNDQGQTGLIQQSPSEKASLHSWVEGTMSFSPNSKQVVGTATVGTFFDEQNYGYLQGTFDMSTHRLGDISAMYGHTLLSPYDQAGHPRRGNINLEAGVVVATGQSLEGSKLPVIGGTGLRLGVNGYYNLDEKGNTTIFGAVDYASKPQELDAQVGLSHKFDRVTISAGYQVSKVEGEKLGHYVTPSIRYKLTDTTELYASGAVSLDRHRPDDKIYAGIRINF